MRNILDNLRENNNRPDKTRKLGYYNVAFCKNSEHWTITQTINITITLRGEFVRERMKETTVTALTETLSKSTQTQTVISRKQENKSYMVPVA